MNTWPPPERTRWAHPAPSLPLVLAVGTLVLLVAGALLLFVDWRQLGRPSALVTFEPHVNGNTITIDGVTDLPDGTRLDWEVRESEAADARNSVYGETEAAAGRFTATAKIREQASGPIMIEVRFYPHDEQPPATVERFGPEGENLRGSGVYDDSGFLYLLVTREMVLP